MSEDFRDDKRVGPAIGKARCRGMALIVEINETRDITSRHKPCLMSVNNLPVFGLGNTTSLLPRLDCSWLIDYERRY